MGLRITTETTFHDGYLGQVNYSEKTHPKGTIPWAGTLGPHKEKTSWAAALPSLLHDDAASGQLPPAPVVHAQPCHGGLSLSDLWAQTDLSFESCFQQVFCCTRETITISPISLSPNASGKTDSAPHPSDTDGVLWLELRDLCISYQSDVTGSSSDLHTYLEATRIGEARISAPNAVVCNPST